MSPDRTTVRRNAIDKAPLVAMVMASLCIALPVHAEGVETVTTTLGEGADDKDAVCDFIAAKLSAARAAVIDDSGDDIKAVTKDKRDPLFRYERYGWRADYYKTARSDIWISNLAIHPTPPYGFDFNAEKWHLLARLGIADRHAADKVVMACEMSQLTLLFKADTLVELQIHTDSAD